MMRDDLPDLPLAKASKKYARLTSKDLGSDWSKKVDMFMDMISAETNQPKEGFRNIDAAGKVPHAIKEASQAALELAAQAWCDDRTSRVTMNVDLAEVFADILDAVEKKGLAKYHAQCTVTPGELAETVVSVLMDDDDERIVAAAVKGSNGKIYRGKAHFGAIQSAAHDGQMYMVHFGDDDLGFVTSKGRWVDRPEAELIGMRHKQLRPEISDPVQVHAADFRF
jgi:hypothetical protein